MADKTSISGDLPATPAPGGALAAPAQRATDLAKAAKAANTQRAYMADWRRFIAWCREHALPALPAAPEPVGLYVADTTTGAAGLNPRSLERALAGIAFQHRLHGVLVANQIRTYW